MPSDDQLDLQTAADELGVHYQTAYRWVRSGKLAAQVVGGKYQVDRSALASVAAARTAPRAPAPPSARRMTAASERMHAALVAGDEAAARQSVTTLVEEGAPIVEVIQQVIVPPLVKIGSDWHDGLLTIWVEHRASAIVERILGGLAPNPRGRRRGTVMVAAVSGDHHSLPTSMAAVALRDDNWTVEHLGANMPPEELLRFCAEHEIDVAVLSSTNPDTARVAVDTAERLQAAGCPVVLGRPGSSLDELIALTRDAARGITSGV